MKHSFALSNAISLCITAAVGAQGVDAAASHHGTLAKGPDIQLGAPFVQHSAALASIDRILAVLGRDPALASPIGYTVELHRVTSSNRLGLPGAPSHFGVRGEAVYFGMESDGHGGQRITPSGGSYDFFVTANAVGYAPEIDNTDAELDGGPRVLGADEGETQTYRVTGQFRGRPIYGGTCTYISHKSTPPVIPVTKQRYLELEMLRARGDSSRHATQQAATSSTPMADELKEFLRDKPKREADNRKIADNMRKAGVDAKSIQEMMDAFHSAEAMQEKALRENAASTDARMAQIVAEGRAGEAEGIRKIQDELDALSPSERRAQAVLTPLGSGRFRLAHSDDTDSLPLMQPNPAFFDKSLAPDAPQVIWICIPGFQGIADSAFYNNEAEGSKEYLSDKAIAEGRARDAVKIRNQLDWAALEALVKP